MDGYELTRHIRSREDGTDAHLPVVAITAGVMAAEIDLCFESGMDDSLSKPLEMPKLKAALEKWAPGAAGKSDASSADRADEVLAVQATENKPVARSSPIDPGALKSVFGDDQETFVEILKEFVDPAASDAEEIRKAIDNRSADGVGNAAHKLKSSSRSVGAMELADICETLESAGRRSDWDTIEEWAPKIPQIIQNVQEYVEGL